MATINGTDNLIAINSDPGDFILGLGGNDTFTGGPGIDTLAGNEGNDLIRSKGKGDLFLGGQGDDTLIGESDTAQEALYGNKGADLIISSPLGGNVMYGGQGNDTIYSLGNDFANGDLGDDIYY
jgi:Ca2+-binding RTX toxin-like protein